LARGEEFIRFLNAIETSVPAGKLIHAIADNYATHKHPKVRQWLVRQPRWTFHFTPTSTSWLNAVEGFFAKLTRRRLKRGVFRSIVELQAAINRFLHETNEKPHRFPLDQGPRQNHRRRQKRAPSVRFYPLSSFGVAKIRRCPGEIGPEGGGQDEKKIVRLLMGSRILRRRRMRNLLLAHVLREGREQDDNDDDGGEERRLVRLLIRGGIVRRRRMRCRLLARLLAQRARGRGATKTRMGLPHLLRGRRAEVD
jgi:transposase